MGRPLKEETILLMNLQASGYTLAKQVGWNRYKVVGYDDKVVRLSEEENLENDDVILTINDNGTERRVREITSYYFYTYDKAIPYVANRGRSSSVETKLQNIYSYTLDENGGIHFDKPGVSYEPSSGTVMFGIEPFPPSTYVTITNGEGEVVEGIGLQRIEAIPTAVSGLSAKVDLVNDPFFVPRYNEYYYIDSFDCDSYPIMRLVNQNPETEAIYYAETQLARTGQDTSYIQIKRIENPEVTTEEEEKYDRWTGGNTCALNVDKNSSVRVTADCEGYKHYSERFDNLQEDTVNVINLEPEEE